MFEDLEMLPRYAPLVAQALSDVEADGRARYVVAQPDGSFLTSLKPIDQLDVWCLVVAPGGEVRLEQQLDREKIRPFMDPAIADGTLVPVDPAAPRRPRIMRAPAKPPQADPEG